MKTIQELEEMLKKGAFDQFEKEPDISIDSIETRKEQLIERIREREEPNVWFEYIPSEKPLSLEEADKLERCFIKKDLLMILSEKQLPIKPNLRKDYLLVEISKHGFIPKVYRKSPCFLCGNPVVVINQNPNSEESDYNICDKCSRCKKCGKTIDAKQLSIDKIKTMKDNGYYCPDCEKEIKQLNKESVDGKLF